MISAAKLFKTMDDGDCRSNSVHSRWFLSRTLQVIVTSVWAS